VIIMIITTTALAGNGSHSTGMIFSERISLQDFLLFSSRKRVPFPVILYNKKEEKEKRKKKKKRRRKKMIDAFETILKGLQKNARTRSSNRKNKTEEHRRHRTSCKPHPAMPRPSEKIQKTRKKTRRIQQRRTRAH